MSGECDKCHEHALDCECKEYKCTICESELILMPSDWPTYPDYWVCPKCDFKQGTK